MLLAANNDRVRESTATVGAGDLALLGAVVGFRAFSAVLNDQDVRPYTIEGLNSGGGPSGEWETGLGTYNAGLNTLSRTTVLASSNAGAAVVFSAGAKQVWIDAPAAFLSGLLQAGNNLADVANVATARHSLGLDAVDAPTFAGLTLTARAVGPNGTAGAPTYSFSASPSSGFYWSASARIAWSVGVLGGQLTSGGIILKSASQLVWGADGTESPTLDLFLARDAANTLAQRNGVNAQTFRVYNTFTDASNNEYGLIGWSANQFQIGPIPNGTGANSRSTRLFAMSGSTGIEFAFGTSVVWKITTGSNTALIPNANGTADFGAAANQVRNAYFSGGVKLMTKAGAVTDADVSGPADGMIAADSTNSKLWMRLGGVWKSVVLA